MNEFKKMQKLAGIITESQLSEAKQTPINELIILLSKAIQIADDNIENADNYDLTDLSQVLEAYVDDLTSIGEFKTFDEGEPNIKNNDGDDDGENFSAMMMRLKNTNESSLNEAEEVYGGQSVDRGDTGSSIEFTIVDNTPEYYTIDYKITPNSRYSSKTASRYNVREPKTGTQRIQKNPDDVQKEWIRVSGDDFLIGKSFAKEIYPG
jgi:hypothetical protein